MGSDLTKPDIQGWLVVVDPDNIYQPVQTAGYDRIQFTYMEDNFSESKSANYSSTQILGRSEPVRGYLGSSPRAISLQLRIPIEGDDQPTAVPKQKVQVTSGLVGDTTTTSTQTYTLSDPDQSDIFARKLQVVDFLRSLVYPHYGSATQQLVYPPPRVLVIFGTWFSLLGIVTNYNMIHKAPWAQNDMTPFFSDVSLTIEECDEPYSFQNVLSGALRTGGLDHSKNSASALTSRIG